MEKAVPIVDELKGLRDLLHAFESGEMKIRCKGEDVTQQKAEFLKLEIAYLEKLLQRNKVENE